MPNPALHVADLPAGVALVPGAVELLGCSPELHDEIAGEVLWLRLSALLAPQADQGAFIVAHDDPRIRAAYEGVAIEVTGYPLADPHCNLRSQLATTQH